MGRYLIEVVLYYTKHEETETMTIVLSCRVNVSLIYNVIL